MDERSNNLFTESWAAILMSLTALMTAWSSYQANLWDSSQDIALSQTLDTQMILTQDVLQANQNKIMDGILVIEIVKSVASGQSAIGEFITSRLREELRNPIIDWLALDPFNNKNAPAHPLHMTEYIEKVVKKEVEKQTTEHNKIRESTKKANYAGATSDSYVLLTVLFAAVLFFAGIATTFNILRLQVTLLGIATIVMLIACWKLLTLSIA